MLNAVKKIKGYDVIKALHVNRKPIKRHKLSLWILTI